MPIEIGCDSCGKRYRVEERFAGKRVKCRNCGAVIAVPAVGEDEFEDLSALGAGRGSQEAMGSAVAAGVEPRDIPSSIHHEDDAPSPDPVLPVGFGAALRAARSRIGVRQFRLQSYPGSQAVDVILPWLIGLSCLVPVVWQGVNAATATDPKWVGLTEYGTVFLLFLALVVPVTYRGIKLAAEMLHFGLPDTAAWRTLALCSVPLALGWMFYLSMEGFSGLVFGVVLGLLVLGPLILIVLQLHWVEAVVAWMMSVLFFGGAAAVTAGVAFIVGLIIVASTAAPLAPAGKPIVKGPTKPNTAVATTVPTTQALVDGTPPPADMFVPATPAMPATNPVATTQPDDFMGFAPVAPPPPPPVVKPPEPKVEHAKIDASPIVASAKELLWLGDFDAVLQSEAAATPLAVRKHAADIDKVQILDVAHDRVTGEASFKKDPASSDQYVINAAGDSVLRVVSWPKLSVQVFAAAPGRAPKIIDLEEIWGNATLLGVAGTDSLFVQREKSGQFGIELWNTRTGVRGRPISVPHLVPNGLAISPDGKTIAVVTKVEGPAQVQLINVATGGVRRVPITSLDTRWPLEPVALTFSPDSSRLAICFEHDGGILAIGWNVPLAKQLYEHVYPAGMMTLPARDQFKGRALDWVGDESTWLLYGQSLIDATSGQTLGTLGVDKVDCQRVIDAKTIALEATLDSGAKRMVQVQLNADGLAKARATTQPAN